MNPTTCDVKFRDPQKDFVAYELNVNFKITSKQNRFSKLLKLSKIFKTKSFINATFGKFDVKARFKYCLKKKVFTFFSGENCHQLLLQSLHVGTNSKNCEF